MSKSYISGIFAGLIVGAAVFLLIVKIASIV